MSNVTHEIVMAKKSERRLTGDKINKQIEKIVESASTKARTERGWTIRAIPHNRYALADERNDPSTGYDNSYIYFVRFEVNCSQNNRSTLDTEFRNIVANLKSLGATPKWIVTIVDGAEPVDDSSADDADSIGYAPIAIPDDFNNHFGHLYGLDPHISRIRGALDAAVRSDWVHRFHCALIGPPGCGKSDICQTLKGALGEEAVLEFDATATTSAGALLELKEREELPRVLLVEEIEKAAENSMQWLLSIMDLRGNIKKRTARGNIDRNTRMLVIATVNDYPQLKRVAYGALASRFSNKIYFHRPERELLERILVREVESVKGSLGWVEPALAFADELKTSDPREVIALALCGRDGLLDGSYQNAVRATGTYVVED